MDGELMDNDIFKTFTGTGKEVCLKVTDEATDVLNEVQDHIVRLAFLIEKNKKMKISVIMPTRNRPDNLRRIFQSAIDTVLDLDNFEFSLRMDFDDIDSVSIINEYSGTYKNMNIRYIYGPRQYCQGHYWNDAWKNATGEIFMMCGDDFVFRTHGWDENIRKEFLKYDDRIAFVYGDDMLQHEALGTHAFIHRNWTDAVGYFVNMRTIVMYHDTWNHVLAEKLGRKVYRPDLIFEHMHPLIGKSVPDDVWLSMSEKGNIPDAKIWEVSWPEMKWDAGKIANVMIDKTNIDLDWGEKDTIRCAEKMLSVLVCHLKNRRPLFDRLMNVLGPQITDNVEILFETDDGELTTGAKRNKLLKRATGKYIVFVDDDDLVSKDYVSLILGAVQNNCDVVGIHLLMITGGVIETECRTYHSIQYDHWYDEKDPDRPGRKRYFRNPNHLNPVKRELALKIMFPEITIGEDHNYSKRLFPLLETETYIEQPIYYYLVRT
jgi:glycosyltransferase involved in cell wall biosynthesis